MRRLTAVLTITVALAAVGALPVAGLAASTSGSGPGLPQADETGNQTTALAPGEQLGGVIGVGEAELESDVDARAFGIQVASAASDDARAAVVSEKLGEIEQRLDTLEARTAALEAARENGSMSEGRFKAEIARIAAETEGVDRLTTQSARAAGELPTGLLDRNGINASAVETLQRRAENLTGPEVAEIARTIAGNSVGESPVEPPIPDGIPADPPGEIPGGPPGADGNATASDDVTPTSDDPAGQAGEMQATPSAATTGSDAGR